MSSERPFYYSVSDPIQHLSLRVSVREIQRGSDASGGGDGESAPRRRRGDTTRRLFGWQEKALAPHELCGTADADAVASLKSNLRNEGVHLFTYVDTDSFSPSEEKVPRTNSMVEPGPLAEAMGNINNKASLSAGASSVHAHLTRDGMYKVMYLMAAVPVDLSKAEAAIDKRDADRLRDRNIVQEHVLCAIKFHKKGSLEVTPGFSEEEPESDDDGPFRSTASLKIIAERGARLTTFTLRVSSPVDGSVAGVYQYTIENVNGMPDTTKLEQLVAEERVKDAQAVALRKGAIPESIHEDLPKDVNFMMQMRIELVSAISFDADWLFCEYQVLLPLGWRPDDPSGWKRNSQGEWTLAGSTQAASCKELRSTMGKDPMLAYMQQRTDSASGSLPYVAILCGAWAIASIIAMLFGYGYGIWLAAAIVLFFVIFGITPTAGDVTESIQPVAHFGLPIRFNVLSSHNNSGELMMATPLVLFQVSSVHSFERHRIQGYGYARLPVAAGSKEAEISTWRPAGDFSSQLADFFVGGANRLSDLRYIAHPPASGQQGDPSRTRFLSKFGFLTHSSGKVRVRVHAMEHRAPPVDVMAPGQKSGAARKPLVDKLMRMYSFDGSGTLDIAKLNKGGSSAQRASDLIKKLQEERDAVHKADEDA